MTFKNQVLAKYEVLEITAANPFRVVLKISQDAFNSYRNKIKPAFSKWLNGVGTFFFDVEKAAKEAVKILPQEQKPQLLTLFQHAKDGLEDHE